MKHKQKVRSYSQSAGNLALAGEPVGVLTRSPRPASRLRVVGDSLGEDSDIDALAPATGMVVGAGLSVILWCLIILAIYGASKLVDGTLLPF